MSRASEEREAAQELAKRFAQPGERIFVEGQPHTSKAGEHFDLWAVTKRPDGKLHPSVEKFRVPLDGSGNPITITPG